MRSALAAVAAICTLFVALLGTAQASPIEDVATKRLDRGYPLPIGVPALSAYLSEIAARSTQPMAPPPPTTSPASIDWLESCDVCGEMRVDYDGQPLATAGPLADLADQRLPRVLRWPAGWTVGQLLDYDPRLAPELLSRADLWIATALTPSGQQLVAISVRPRLDPPRSGVNHWPEGAIDPRAPGRAIWWSEIDAPLRLQGGDIDVTLPVDGAVADQVVFAADGGVAGPLAWDMKYTLTQGDATTTVTTTPTPNHGAPVLAASLSPEARQVISHALHRSPPLVRRIWRQLGGRLTIREQSSCGLRTSCAEDLGDGRYLITLNPSHITDGPRGYWIVMHEFGHIVSFAGLSPLTSEQRWPQMMRAHLGYQRAVGARRRANVEEWWAEQFTYWATGNRRSFAAYRVPSIYTNAQFGGLVDRWWGLRPKVVNG